MTVLVEGLTQWILLAAALQAYARCKPVPSACSNALQLGVCTTAPDLRHR